MENLIKIELAEIRKNYNIVDHKTHYYLQIDNNHDDNGYIYFIPKQQISRQLMADISTQIKSAKTLSVRDERKLYEYNVITNTLSIYQDGILVYCNANGQIDRDGVATKELMDCIL